VRKSKDENKKKLEYGLEGAPTVQRYKVILIPLCLLVALINGDNSRLPEDLGKHHVISNIISCWTLNPRGEGSLHAYQTKPLSGQGLFVDPVSSVSWSTKILCNY
jgi:hypothetical protein